MKVRVVVTLKPGVLDAEGRALEHALRDLGYDQLAGVRTGKVVELSVDAPDEARARTLVTEMCEKLLANPVIEQYEIEF